MNRTIWGLIAGLFIGRLVMALVLPLTPQEAYYWNYSRHLALSYFDHPPLTAWTIFLFALVLGHTELAVRLPALLYSAGTFLVLYALIRKLAGPRLREFLPLLLAPFFVIGSSQMLPDSPLLFFFALSLYFGHRAVVEGDKKAWYVFGAAAGMALLSKYSAVLIFVGLGIYALLAKSRDFLCSRSFWISLLLCGLIFAPVVVWNIQNHWTSFLFQSARRAQELSEFSPYNFGRYLVTQILIVSPVLWLVNWRALWIGFRDKREEANRSVLFLAAFALPFFLFFTLLSFVYWVKLNWLWPGYLCAIALAVILSSLGKMRFWFKTNLASSIVFLAPSVFLLFYQPLAVNWPGNSLAGWRELADKVEKMKKRRGGDWLAAGYEYKTASELAFYLPGQPETYSNPLIGQPGLQYDFWFDAKEVLGKNFLFVVDRRDRLNDAPAVLPRFFERIEAPDSLVIKSGRGYVTTFYMYPCFGYKGR